VLHVATVLTRPINEGGTAPPPAKEQFSAPAAIGGSFLGSERKDFFPDLQYIDGYKALVNLFYKRPILDKQVVSGFEVEYAQRTNMDGTRNGTTRMSVLLYYDF
jgi:hypothetical protein